jgi:hypothetical protein
MLHRRKTLLWLVILSTWFGISAFIVPEVTPEKESQTLFRIARSKDPNEIWYALNLDQNGFLNTANPVKPFWVKQTASRKIEPLTWIQTHYAYGIKVLDSENRKSGEWQFQFVSYKKRTFTLRQTDGNQFKVYTNLDNLEIEVIRIFIQIEGGSFWVPSIPFVKLIGIVPESGEEITETIIP